MTNQKLRLRELITPTPHAVQASSPLDEAARLMREEGIRHLPVLEGTQVVGVLSDRDVRTAEGQQDACGQPRFSVRQACTSPAYVVDIEVPAADVVRTMADRRLGCALVTDQGKLAGILTTTDVASRYAEDLRSS